MKVILMLSQKGGCGKSTIARNLAVIFAKTHTTSLLDLDPQGSSLDWGARREELKEDIFTSYLDINEAESYLNNLEEGGCDVAIIDTPPILSNVHRILLNFADFVIIPMQTAFDDIPTIANNIELVESTRIPYGIVINKAREQTKIYKDGKLLLAEYGRILGTLSDTVQMQHASYEYCGISELDPKHKNSIALEKIKSTILKSFGEKVKKGDK